ncbi:MAG: META domain-containing protein [Sulfitobacter sp.]
MRNLLISGLMAMTLATCDAGDETVRAYGAADKTWVLESIDEAAFEAAATLTFPEPGRIAGKAPCNAFSADMTVPYPWFETGPIMATRMACPDLPAETEFLTALSDMTLSEVLGDTLVLSNDANRSMVFRVRSR